MPFAIGRGKIPWHEYGLTEILKLCDKVFAVGQLAYSNC